MLRALSTAVTVGVLTAACAVGPNYRQPTTPVTATSFVGAEPGVYSTQEIQPQFWQQFHDALLDQLLDEALGANHDLRIAIANLQAVRAVNRETRFDLFPTVTAAGSYTHQQYPPAESFGSAQTLDLSYYTAGFDAFWELDFFGRVRRGIEASHAEVQSAEASLRDAQVSVTAEVARTYFELRGQQNELDVAQRNVANQQQTLRLTTSQLEAGRGTELDTSRQQAQLSSTLGTIPPLQAAIERSIHRLSVLTGREPTALRARLSPPHEMPPLPQITAVSDPAGLLRRRPDIRVAERTLAADTARIGVAVADLFPKVTFNGNFGYAASAPSLLGSSGTRTFLIGPSISWAAFDLGRVRARIAGARAQTDGALAAYEQTVLRALEETENALTEHARARDRLAQMADAARASRTAAQIAHARYEGGMVGFLEVLDAERTQLEAEDQLAQSRTETATSLIAVYKALGGAWEAAAPAQLARHTPTDGPAG
ncbi:MAG TPA: efflux transporter outer membrane subunit [Steroidobacteraceae bacterium]|nr:efflux transporter outer membrane subunit [Steroidobacteraceae bacterium]